MLNRVTQVPWSWGTSFKLFHLSRWLLCYKSWHFQESRSADQCFSGQPVAERREPCKQPAWARPAMSREACHRFSWAHYALVPGLISSHHLLSYLSREGLSMECCRVRDGCQVCDSSGMWWVYRPLRVHLCGCALCAPAFLCPFVGVPVCVPMCLSPQVHVHACLWTSVHSPTCMCLYDHGRWGPAL